MKTKNIEMCSQKYKEYKQFDVSKYETLENIAQQIGRIEDYERISKFLLTYINREQDVMLLKDGLVDTLIINNNVIIKKIGKRRGKSQKKSIEYKKLNAYLYFLQGNIEKSILLMIELDIFAKNISYKSYLPFKYNTYWRNSPIILARDFTVISEKDVYSYVKEHFNKSKYILLTFLSTLAEYLQCLDMSNALNKIWENIDKTYDTRYPKSITENYELEDCNRIFDSNINNKYLYFMYSYDDEYVDTIEYVFGERLNISVKEFVERFYFNNVEMVKEELEKASKMVSTIISL